MDFKDYYATLGVDKQASADDIQKAYRKLARKYHPDVNSNAGAEDRFKEIAEAYEVLKDPDKRSTYDRFGANWKNVGQGGQGGGGFPGFEGFDFHFDLGSPGGGGASGFSSFFDMLFGSGTGRGAGGPGAGGPRSGANPFADFGFSDLGGRGRRGGRGLDQEAKIALTLEEAAAGGQREITITDPTIGRARSFNVNLPAGVRPGQKIRLQGRGGQQAGGPAGDLYLKVDFKPHDRFRLDGLDLFTDLPVAPWEAALGVEAAVRTLNGTVKIRIPAGSSSGRKIRLRNKGFPSTTGTRGDLYAEIRVVVPSELTPRERELFEELARTSTFRPR